MKSIYNLAIFTGMILATGPASARNLATVNGAAVTGDELIRSAESISPEAAVMLDNPVMRRRLLDHLVESRLGAAEARRENLQNDPEYKALLAETETRLLADLYVRRYVAANTREDQLRAYFAQHRERWSSRELKASHIILNSEEDARKVLQELAAGADFAGLLARHQAGKTGEQGGNTGWFGRGRMLKEFEDAAFGTPVGQVHKTPVRTTFGWHVIQVLEERGSDKVAFETVRAKVAEDLEMELRAALKARLLKSASVVIHEDAVKEFRGKKKI